MAPAEGLHQCLCTVSRADRLPVHASATPCREEIDGLGCCSDPRPDWVTFSDTYRQLSLFGDVFERVRADDVEKPDDSKLIESAINGMLAGLDPHSSYMDSKSFR